MKIILTGATGMVGEGVLHECINEPSVDTILVLTRKPTGIIHPKIAEIIHADFFNLEPIAGKLAGYDACLFCLGVSSVGMKEETYTKFTYTLTLHAASIFARENPSMIFCYISGSGTDSTEQGRVMWARVKGKTENDLQKLPFKAVYNFRPGYMQPTKGLKNTLGFYKWFSWTYPLLRILFPNKTSTLKQLGLAMIYVAKHGYEKRILEVNDIVKLAAIQN